MRETQVIFFFEYKIFLWEENTDNFESISLIYKYLIKIKIFEIAKYACKYFLHNYIFLIIPIK